jgi:hypothetical protein
MAAATKKSRSTAPPIERPPEGIVGGQEWQQPGWLAPSADGLPEWLVELHAEHLDRLADLADWMEAEREAVDAKEGEGARHRLAVRRALDAGKPPPKAPDPSVSAVVVARAREDVRQGEGAVARAAVRTMTALRARRAEVEPLMPKLSAQVRTALMRGPGGKRAARVAAIVAELARLEAVAPIETFGVEQAPDNHHEPQEVA